MTPTELRQAVPVEVEQHMREKGLWPVVDYVDMRNWIGADCWSVNCNFAPPEIAEALIGWAIEGQLIRTHFTMWDKSGGYCVYGVGGPALQVIESHNERLPALVAAYRRIVMGESK